MASRSTARGESPFPPLTGRAVEVTPLNTVAAATTTCEDHLADHGWRATILT